MACSTAGRDSSMLPSMDFSASMLWGGVLGVRTSSIACTAFHLSAAKVRSGPLRGEHVLPKNLGYLLSRGSTSTLKWVSVCS